MHLNPRVFQSLRWLVELKQGSRGAPEDVSLRRAENPRANGRLMGKGASVTDDGPGKAP